jgi:hypothetical protein
VGPKQVQNERTRRQNISGPDFSFGVLARSSRLHQNLVLRYLVCSFDNPSDMGFCVTADNIQTQLLRRAPASP